MGIGRCLVGRSGACMIEAMHRAAGGRPTLDMESPLREAALCNGIAIR
jgi:hypothetical protein